MVYNTAVEIKLPRTRVLELFEDLDAMKKWQPSLVEYRLLDEDRREKGSRMSLVYDMNGRRTEMTETLLERNLPDRIVFTYEVKGVWNKVANLFEELGDGRTLWTQENEFRCKGLMALFCLFAPGAFKKETLKAMKSFKEFAQA